MRLAVIVPGCVPSDSSGEDMAVSELVCAIADSGVKVTVMNLKPSDFRPTAFKHVRLQYPAKRSVRIRQRFRAAIKTAFGKYDTVHIFDYGMFSYLPLFKFFGKHTVVTVDDYRQTPELLRCEKAAVKHADDIIVSSKYLETYYNDKYKCDVALINHGAAPYRGSEAGMITRKYGLKKNSYILCIGGTDPESRKLLIKAFTETVTDIKLVLEGGQEEVSTESESAIRAIADGKIIIIAGYSGSCFNELVTNCLFCVCPDAEDRNDYALRKALRTGISCLVSDTPNHEALIASGAEAFTYGDGLSLKQRLSDMLSVKAGSDGRSLTENVKGACVADLSDEVKSLLDLYSSPFQRRPGLKL